MTSPFKSYEEYYEATGPIYTFSDRPAIIALLLIASALIFLYFIYACYTMGKNGASQPKSPVALSILLVAGIASAAGAVYQQVSGPAQRPQAAVTRSEGYQASQKRLQPLALLGLTGVTGLGARGARRHRPKRLTRR